MNKKGKTKPWEQNNTKWLDPNYDPSNVTTASTTIKSRFKKYSRHGHNGSSVDHWFRTLREIEKETNITLSLDFMRGSKERRRPPVGRFSSYEKMIDHIRAKRWNNWTSYA